MAVEFVRGSFGTPGILASAALLGLTDVDALTLAMNRLGESSTMIPIAARAIAVGIIANSVFKLALTLLLGSTPFRLVASSGLALLTATLAGSLWLFWR
jgi:uncharacterized membrane protein (DUF4010 family)